MMETRQEKEVIKKADMRQEMVAAFIRGMEEGINLVVVVADSTSTAKISPFADRYPERIVNVGIAEQNLVGVASGLALGGMVAFTCNAAPFLVARANEQIKNDVCYSQADVRLVGLNAGFAYSNLGSTHHAVDDLSIMRGFGNISIFAPSDPVEARAIFTWALHNKGPMYIRMDSAEYPFLHDDSYRFNPGQVDILKHGKDVTICAIGSTVPEAWAAAQELAGEGIDAELLNISSLRPLDRVNVAALLRKTGRVVTAEEHSVNGGLGSTVAEIIAENVSGARLKRLGIADGTFAKCGPRNEVRHYHQIDKEGIAAAARKMVNDE